MTHEAGPGNRPCAENKPPAREKDVTLNSGTSGTSTNLYEAGEGGGFQQGTKEGPGADLPLGLALEDYVAWAAQEHKRRAAVPRRWESELWTFVRLVKAHPDLCDRSGQEAFRKVEAIMKRWHEPGVKIMDVWDAFFQVSRDTADAEFSAWEQVRVTPGLDPFANAFDESLVHPLELCWQHRQGRPDVYNRFISLAGWLQVVMGARPILLPVERVAELLTVTKMGVTRMRGWAKSDGYIREMKAAEFQPGKKGRATEFVFRVACCPILRNKAEQGTEELFDGDPSLFLQARQVVAYYQQVIAPEQNADGGEAAVRGLLRAGRTEKELRRAADLYAALCARNRVAARFRQAARNFYCGKDGSNWQWILEEAGAN